MEKIIRDRIEKIEKDIVPEGYKKTTIGIIPQDWQVKKLGEIAEKICDGSHTTPKYVNKGIKFFSVENITNNEFEDTKFISEDEYKFISERCLLEKNDILMTRIGSLGKTKLIDWDVKAGIYVSLANIKLKKNNNYNFIYQFTKTNIFIKEVYKRALINAVPMKINLGEINNINIPLPSLEEQEKIADILTLWDEYIENMDNLIEKKEELKKGLMQKLLTGEKRLPGYAQPWKKAKVKDIFDKITRGNVLATSKICKEILGEYIYPVYSSQTLNNGLMGYYNEYIFENAITWTTDGANAGTVNYRKGKFYCTNVCGVLLSENGYANKCMAEILNLVSYKYVSYVGNPKLMNNIMKEITINLPPLDEQKAIGDILSKADEEIELLKELRDKKLEEKKGLMQLLLTGIIRV